ncbi:MAG TPA: hypothetical protein VK507_15755 [Iamia sp.]|nr:hypothetical protein [Iamia sp.]
MAKAPRPVPTLAELDEASHHITGEWLLVADRARLITTRGARSAQGDAALESTLMHARCLINFCCGGYRGAHNDGDIQPGDFLGRPWWPRDEPFDRLIRGRLRFINQELQHLSWQRVRNKEPLMVSVHLLAHEVHWAMHLFVEELRADASQWLARFEAQEQLVDGRLPRLNRPGQTVPHLAPARANPIPPSCPPASNGSRRRFTRGGVRTSAYGTHQYPYDSNDEPQDDAPVWVRDHVRSERRSPLRWLASMDVWRRDLRDRKDLRWQVEGVAAW